MPRSNGQPGLMEFLESRDIDVVFDVGANEGFFGEFLRQEGYRGLIVSFEPLDQVFGALERRASGDSGWEVHRVGLGDTPGAAVINVSEASVFSSLLPHRDAALSFDARSAPERTEKITLDTLDSFAGRFAGRRCFLKIDTQGYEHQVLCGATATLPTPRTDLLGAAMRALTKPPHAPAWPF